MQNMWINYDINNVPIKRPTYGRNKHLTKVSCSIGEFHMAHYQPMLKKYAYHRILLCLLGKHGWNNLRREYFLDDNNTVMIEHGYAELLKAKLIWKSIHIHLASAVLSP